MATEESEILVSEESTVDEEMATDYNNEVQSSPSSENINNFSNSSSQTDNFAQVTHSDNSTNNEPYSQLFEDNPDNPFFKCKISPLNYDTDEEQNFNELRFFVTWNYEINYDYFNINSISCYAEKNESFFLELNNLKLIRNTNNNTTGIFKKIENKNFKKNDIVHSYVIVYYDNAKCNIEFYGIFNQELDEDILIKNIIDEKVYGKNGKIIPNLYTTSTGGNDFVVIYTKVTLQ